MAAPLLTVSWEVQCAPPLSDDSSLPSAVQSVDREPWSWPDLDGGHFGLAPPFVLVAVIWAGHRQGHSLRLGTLWWTLLPEKRLQSAAPLAWGTLRACQRIPSALHLFCHPSRGPSHARVPSRISLKPLCSSPAFLTSADSPAHSQTTRDCLSILILLGTVEYTGLVSLAIS